jgi:steroid Delta-isomerase
MNRLNIEGFIQAARHLTPTSVGALADFYAEDCIFSDPFQTVKGRQAVEDVYRDMFKNLHQPGFHDIRIIAAPTQEELMLQWRFEFAFKAGGVRHSIMGSSLLEINPLGRIAQHTDYWDASRLMQSLPLIGPVIAWIRRKIAHA